MKTNPLKRITKILLIILGVTILSTGLYGLQFQPDLIVVESALRNSLKVDSVFNDDACYINEGCLSGTGNRHIIKFTTQIANVGDADFYAGEPPGPPGNTLWVYDDCHRHWHYDGYAEYILLDEQDNVIPAGFKTGFCLTDIYCEPGYVKKYDCQNQGISAHCTDVYSSGLDCQWIDITSLAEGVYKLKVRVNYQEEPDFYGIYESTYQNNSAEVCFELFRTTSGRPYIYVPFLGMDCASYDCYETTLTIQFDGFAQENSWQLSSSTSNITLYNSGGVYSQNFSNTTLSEIFCLPEDCYTFTFFDNLIDGNGNNGICCQYGNGSYKIYNSSGIFLVDESPQDGSYWTSQFCITSTDPCNDADGDGICTEDDCNDNDDTVPGPAGAACDDNDPNTIHDEIQADGCTCAGSIDSNCIIEMSLFLQFDNFPRETSWEIRDANGFLVDSRPVYDGYAGLSVTSEDICLVNGCYTLIMNDTFGDGMCCNAGDGYYFLTNSFNEIVAEGSTFTHSETTTFCVAPCESDLYINSLSNVNTTYKASNNIIGVGDVTGSNSSVTFSASQRVQLKTGFGVEAGVNFTADNNGCGN